MANRMTTDSDISQFEFGRKLADVSNSGDKDQLYKLIGEYDFTDKPFAASIAIEVISITAQEVIKYMPIVKQFSKAVEKMTGDDLDFRAYVRVGYLIEKIKEIDGKFVEQ